MIVEVNFNNIATELILAAHSFLNVDKLKKQKTLVCINLSSLCRGKYPYVCATYYDNPYFVGGEKHFDENFQKLMSNFPETLGNAIVAEMNYTGEDGERVYVTADLFRMSVVEEKDKKTVQYFWNKGHREDKRSVYQFPLEHVKEYPLI